MKFYLLEAVIGWSWFDTFSSRALKGLIYVF
jgi:hypothetical protein